MKLWDFNALIADNHRSPHGRLLTIILVMCMVLTKELKSLKEAKDDFINQDLRYLELGDQLASD